MAIEAGPAAERLSARATLADLVVVPFRNSERASRINLGSLLGDSPRPVLVATDRTPRAPGQVLVVLDGSEQSEQALYLAAYAALCWSSRLSLVGAPDTGRRAAGILARACEYLLTRDIESDDAPADFWDGSPQEKLAVYDLTLTGTAIRNPKSQLSSKGSLGRLLSPEGCPVLICT
jgi:hypothetical protein